MRAFIFALSLTILLAHAAPARAQKERDASRDWSAVQGLTADEKIVVRTDYGDKFTGRFVRANDSSLVIKRDGKEMSIARNDVRSVSYPGGKSRSKGALVGAAIGGGSGLGFGLGIYSSQARIPQLIPGFAAAGAGIGAGIGAAIGMNKRDVRIYEAP